jgi:hypothetical protein
MREWLGSLGLAISQKYSFETKRKDDDARIFAEVFVNMIQFSEDKWAFDSIEVKKRKEKLMPSYNALKTIDEFEQIRILLDDMKKIRNGFDHGWTGKHISGVPENIHSIFESARNTFRLIIDNWNKIQNHFNQNNQANQSSDKC